jgi:hypothetical protein
MKGLAQHPHVGLVGFGQITLVGEDFFYGVVVVEKFDLSLGHQLFSLLQGPNLFPEGFWVPCEQDIIVLMSRAVDHAVLNWSRKS